MIAVNKSTCPQNHPCPVVRLCPTGAITQPDIYSAPVVDQSKCTECMRCTMACGSFQHQPAPVVNA